MKFDIQVATDATEDDIRSIIAAREAAFPREWAVFERAHEYYRDLLRRDDVFAVMLRHVAGDVKGFMMLVPYAFAFEELQVHDSLMPPPSDRPGWWYIETLYIHPELQRTFLGGRMFFRMIAAMFAEGARREKNNYALHARASGAVDLSRVVREGFKDIVTAIRPIDSWTFNGGEPSDYIEVAYRRP